MLNYIRWDVDPVIVQAGPVKLAWYGLLLVAGFIFAYMTFKKIAMREKVDMRLIEKFAIWTIVWTIVGLRLGHCLFYDWAYFKDHILEIFVPFEQTNAGWQFTGFQGLASHGGVIGIILFTLYFTWRKKINLLWLLDRLAIAVPVAACLVRCGNLMNSEIIGTFTSLPWGFEFIKVDGENAPARHPTQIYEALVYILLFCYQLWYYFKHSKGHIPAGRSVGTLLVVIFTARFLIEFVKENQVPFENTMTLDMGQWLSIPFIILGLGFLGWSIFKKDYPTATKPKSEQKTTV
ncbi:MAG: prolipoprotein diacylglyceryl transferase [Bacteroidales bacterium]|jgi:prolipoprotein diacylglyceryl transferase|nr:prolipoprotein diacylglyceryl transferase [Bacteroidales bacterium]